MYSNDPAGSSKVACQTPSAASKMSSVAAHSGCQSPGQPSTDWSDPAIATLVGGGVSSARTTAGTGAIVASRAAIVGTSSMRCQRLGWDPGAREANIRRSSGAGGARAGRRRPGQRCGQRPTCRRPLGARLRPGRAGGGTACTGSESAPRGAASTLSICPGYASQRRCWPGWRPGPCPVAHARCPGSRCPVPVPRAGGRRSVARRPAPCPVARCMPRHVSCLRAWFRPPGPVGVARHATNTPPAAVIGRPRQKGWRGVRRPRLWQGDPGPPVARPRVALRHAGSRCAAPGRVAPAGARGIGRPVPSTGKGMLPGARSRNGARTHRIRRG